MTDDQTHVLYLGLSQPSAEVIDVEPGCLPKSYVAWFVAGMTFGFALGGVVVFAILAVMMLG